MALTENTKKSIAAFDATLDTSLQLNSSKVPAQKGVYSLIIGVGGTGVDALLETKGMINKTCCMSEDHKDLPTDHVVYLAFDTDNRAETKTSSRQSGGASLDTRKGELVKMQDGDIATFLRPAYRQLVPDYISSWLDFNIDANTGTNGAGGVRQCGRLLLFRNVERIRTAIDSAVRNMVADQKVEAMNVYLLSGIGGGTGSGTFLDLAYIANDVVSSIVREGKTTVYGYLFLPDINLSRALPDETKIYIKKNGYAALKEVDYLMNLPKDDGRFVQRYTPSYVIDTNMAPFNFVHLVSGTGSNGQVLADPYGHSMRAVAQSILSFVAKEEKDGVATKFAMQSHYDNIGQATAQHISNFPERSNCYLALGTYNYELPIDQILLYVTSLLFDKMDSMFQREPEQKDINAAYKSLGLAPAGLMSALIGNGTNLAPNGVKWEDLFGKNAKYNYGQKCNQWIDRTTVDIRRRAKEFVKEFPAQFKRQSDDWFTDGKCGPIWVNHLIVNDKEDCSGLTAKLKGDLNKAGVKLTNLRTELQTADQAIRASADQASKAGFFSDREGKASEYINALNRYADMCLEVVALEEMRNIYQECINIIVGQNNKLFDVVVQVLLALKGVCEQNANILTRATLNDAGNHFTWQPLRIPDVSDTIRQAFDAQGDAQQTIANFSQALLNHAKEWSEGNVDVKAFIREYLDQNLSNIANCSLETYVKAALHGDSLEHSISTSLAPKIAAMSVPLFSLTSTPDVGGEYTMLSIPYSCQDIKQAFINFYSSDPDRARSTVIQSSGINSRIFAQSLLSCIPLSSYRPLAEYEQAYLTAGANGNAGMHLYMNRRGENWSDLPSPIPYRSRPKMAGAYPKAIENIENRERDLYKECRGLPIIRCDDSNGYYVYRLYIAQMPDLDHDFSEASMKDDNGRLDAGRLANAIKTLDDWLANGLPDRPLSDAVHTSSYIVAMIAIMANNAEEKANAEVVAQECLLGEYNNLRRAREELDKYHALQEKRNELNDALSKTAGVAQKARHLVMLLTSGMVRSARLEDGTPVYNYVAGQDENGNDRERLLVKVGTRRLALREVVLSNAFEALNEDPEPMKHKLYEQLKMKAEKAYRRMDAEKDTAEEKLRKLKALAKGIQSRYERVRDDVMDGIAEDGVDHETVGFYEKLMAQLRREERDMSDLLESFSEGGDFDEF